jgi:F-box/WD-40 domain protein 7
MDAAVVGRIEARKVREKEELLAMEAAFKERSRGGARATSRASAAPRLRREPQPQPRAPRPSARAELREIYQRACPDKVKSVDAVLRKWRGREAELMSRVRAKYGGADLAPRRASAPPRHAAATSHLATREYMERFDAALEGGAGEYCGSAALDDRGAVGAPCPSRALRALRHRPLPRAALAAGWSSGVVVSDARWDVSDRPILASSLHEGNVAVACSDHAAYVCSTRAVAEAGRGGGAAPAARKLHAKRCGHTDWVTCVAHVPGDGRVLTGGADAKLCLWSAGGGARCADLVGHRGSISAVDVAADGACAVSSSYDATLRVWDLRRGAPSAAAAVLQRSARRRGHRDPVLCFAWLPAHEVLLSGDRAGDVLLWDVRAGSVSRALEGHRGHITALECSLGRAGAGGGDGGGEADSDARSLLFFTGAQDGHVRVWDPRQARAVCEIPAHVGRGRDGSTGSGAVHTIALAERGALLVTGGADGAVCTFDARAGFRARASFRPAHSDFVYAMRVVGDRVLTGGGGGDVILSSLADGSERTRVRGSRVGAVRCIEADRTTLVVAGDDGDVACWVFAP